MIWVWHCTQGLAWICTALLSVPLKDMDLALHTGSGPTQSCSLCPYWICVHPFDFWVWHCTQGLAWTCTVLLIVPLFKDDQRGLALGLNEAMGYTCLAAMAPVYGQLERWMVGCSWAGEDEVTPECLSASKSTCASPDGWVPECVGQCKCGSYTGLVARVGGVIVATGLGLCIALILLQLFGPTVDPAGPQGELKGSTAKGGSSGTGYSMVAETEAGGAAAGPHKHQLLGSGLGEGVIGAGRDAGEVELGVAAIDRGGDWEKSRQAGSGNLEHRMVNGEAGIELGGGAAVQGSPLPSAMGKPSGARHRGVGLGAGNQGRGHVAGAKTDGLVGISAPGDRLQGGHCVYGGALDQQVQGVGGGDSESWDVPVPKTVAFLRFTLGLGNEHAPPVVSVLAWNSRSSSGGGVGDRGDRGLLEGEDSVRAQVQGDHGLLEGAGHGSGRLGLAPRARSKKGGRSTLVLCVAGMACNMVASLAWGMLLSWARDLLLIPGPGRDLMASTYQFMMAATLLLAAHTSGSHECAVRVLQRKQAITHPAVDSGVLPCCL
ncbi:hypothetical protein DUNSADRAFT_4573 [Dunaliella salina]|uniref:Uncharacterized protein n=1 Tax=Dunaliella salina TaxID=3046 RepID=A0ABQ7GRR8_DUNSA|nr:hypothetical protein DUNSADRAFT_4573 [Dunaliella salina]|eukprot:KAF5837310.1 hypothetical protein DUNSADRAFT_4573 [Dunaliella salina]